jgi:hypothetical protein
VGVKNRVIVMGIVGGLLLALAAINAQSEQPASQAPSVAQPLVREGDFAMKLAEQLKLGPAQNEAEAESILTSTGIAPKNGWIADYPVTPDVIGELQNAVGEAAESGRLSISKDEAASAFEDLASAEGLPIMASAEGDYADSEPASGYGSYSSSGVINDYYSNEGPPIVTYYPPPVDYYSMYAWVPYPFWWSGFWFPGFFCLHDFDRIIVIGHKHHRFTNHHFHPRWQKTVTIDPARRSTDKPFRAASDRPRTHGGYGSAEARSGASSIFERSRERARSGGSAMARPDRRTNDRSSSAPPTFRGRNAEQPRSPASDRRTSRPPTQGNPGGRLETYSPPPSPRTAPNTGSRSNINPQGPASGQTGPPEHKEARGLLARPQPVEEVSSDRLAGAAVQAGLGIEGL